MTSERNDINQWLQDAVKQSENEWVVLTIRADGTVTNGSQVKQTLWSTSATYSIDKVNRALDWTITEERRKHKKRLGFAAWLGGDKEYGVQDHIHAAMEIPANCDKHEMVNRLNYLWNRNLKKLFKQEINSVIYLDEEALVSAERYGSYCIRSEGSVRIGPTDKLLMSRSLSL
jgi:hypothetical protein